MSGSFSEEVRIKEDSLIARLAARKLKCSNMAVVLGNTIHLHNVSAESFRQNRAWWRHELTHVQQFRRYGFMPFLLYYLLESIRHGYHNNKFEIEARQAEEQA